MHAADAADLANGLNHLDADIESLASLILGAAQTRDQRVRNMHAGDVLAHPLCRLCRAQWADACENMDLAEQTQCFHLLHETAQHRQVEAVLRLDELRARGHLFSQTPRPPLMRQSEWILGGT